MKLMQNPSAKYLAILLTLLLFTSCGSSDDNASSGSGSGSGSGTNQPADNWDEMKWDEGEWQ